MKQAKATLALAAILLAVTAGVPALAHGGGHHGGHHGWHGGHHGGWHHHGSRVHFGLFVGAPGFWYDPWPAPYPYYPYSYYYPPAVVVQSSPPVYIERDGNTAAPGASDYWYYCADAKRYYPYVKQCPGGWQRITPHPPPPPS